MFYEAAICREAIADRQSVPRKQSVSAENSDAVISLGVIMGEPFQVILPVRA
jgi:hypothetical protein